jgi:lipid-binding SYLF domain-containing protein
MKSLLKFTSTVGALGLGAILFAGCATAPPTETARDNLKNDADTTIKNMENMDASLSRFVDNSRAYAVFPNVGKGGLIAGGAYGRGVLYEHGMMTGYADITQATVGAQVGGETFSEIVVFQSDDALQRFKSGKLQFDANASAVLLSKGGAASANYANGVAVFVETKGGAMAEAAIGGQQFTFVPAGTNQNDNYNNNR